MIYVWELFHEYCDLSQRPKNEKSEKNRSETIDTSKNTSNYLEFSQKFLMTNVMFAQESIKVLTNTKRSNFLMMNFPFWSAIIFGSAKQSVINELTPISWPQRKVFWVSDTQDGWKKRTDWRPRIGSLFAGKMKKFVSELGDISVFL